MLVQEIQYQTSLGFKEYNTLSKVTFSAFDKICSEFLVLEGFQVIQNYLKSFCETVNIIEIATYDLIESSKEINEIDLLPVVVRFIISIPGHEGKYFFYVENPPNIFLAIEALQEDYVKNFMYYNKFLYDDKNQPVSTPMPTIDKISYTMELYTFIQKVELSKPFIPERKVI